MPTVNIPEDGPLFITLQQGVAVHKGFPINVRIDSQVQDLIDNDALDKLDEIEGPPAPPSAGGASGLGAQQVTADGSGEVSFDIADGSVVLLTVDGATDPGLSINDPLNPQVGQFMVVVVVVGGVDDIELTWNFGRSGFAALTPGAILVLGEWVYQGEEAAWLPTTRFDYNAETDAVTVDNLEVQGSLSALYLQGTWQASGSNPAVGEAGAGAALPATPETYLRARDENGTEYAIPAFLPIIT